MIKKIIQIADVHIPNIETEKPYTQMLENLIVKLAKEVNEDENVTPDETRIVLAGDIFDFKNKVSPEANTIFYTLLNYLNELARTIIIAGNHDLLENNKQRKDALSPVFEISDVYPNVTYADMELDYQSGIIEDDNVVWVLYSIFDHYKGVDTEDIRRSHKGKKIIGLFHGDIAGAVTDSGRMTEKGIDPYSFEHCDAVLCGHIHKRQTLMKNGVPCHYSGSLFQKDMGEKVSGHGYTVWNLENEDLKDVRTVDVENDYAIYKFRITSYDDVENNIEKLMNL